MTERWEFMLAGASIAIGAAASYNITGWIERKWKSWRDSR